MIQNGKLEVLYHEVSLDLIVKHYAKEFKSHLQISEWWCDIAKNKVVFKLYDWHKADEKEGE